MNKSVYPSVFSLQRFSRPPLGTVSVVASSLIAEGEPLEALQGCLSPDEISKQNRFIPPVVKRRYGVCRGKLRHLLAALLGISPSGIHFEYNATGKPRLSSKHKSSIEFNVSHSGDWALFGFTDGSPVGVDVELFQRKTNFEALAPQVLHANERKQLELVAPAERNMEIMRAWVAKEAVLKAIGVGIGFGLHAAEFPIPQAAVGAPTRIDPMLLEKMDDDASCRMNSWIDAAMWRVHHIDALQEGCCAVAIPKSIDQVRVERF